MVKEEVEKTLLCLIAQYPVKMYAQRGQLFADLFSMRYYCLAEVLLKIAPDDMSYEYVTHMLKSMDPTVYGGDGAVKSIFNSTVQYRPATVQILVGELFDLHNRETVRSVGYELIAAADAPASVYMSADAARIRLSLPMPGETVRDTEAIFKDMLSPERKENRLRSHIRPLDQFVMGFEPGELVIIAGNGGMGKTSVALHVFAQNVLHDVPIGFHSLEMSDTQLLQRVCTSVLGIEHRSIKEFKLNQREVRHLEAFKKKLSGLRYYIDTRSRGLNEICNVIRKNALQGYKGFVVDYLQLVNYKQAKSREQEVSTIVRSLKDVAMEAGTVVFALSQLNRENQKRGDTRPKLSDLRESGEIEQAADYVIFPYRPMYFYPDKVDPDIEEEIEYIIEKGRSCGTGKVKGKWQGRFTRLVDE